MADDSTPFGPIVVVGTVVVVGAVGVVVVGGVDNPVALVVVVVPEAKLGGAIVTTKVSASTTLAMSTRDGDSPRFLFTMPPRSRRCVDERS